MAKVTTEHVEAMRALIAPLDNEAMREMYRNGHFPNADKAKDLNKRYRWDLFYAAKAYRAFDSDADYMDSHLDTALRAIVPTLDTL